MLPLLPTKRRALPLLALVLAAAPLAAAERHLYKETRDDTASSYEWTLTAEGDEYRITFTSPAETFVNDCDADGSTRRWRMKSAGIEAQAYREGGTIVLSGRREGKPVERRIEIGDEPWYQPLSYSLRQFARSGKATTRFWMLRPDTLAPVRLKAERAGRETIDTAHGPAPADKVRISTTGLLTGLWHAHYWFDAKTGVFLRYEGVNGLSRDAKTVIQLIE